MYFSKIFVPTTREDPSDAELISHKLMIRSGMIKKTAAGIYNWLPLGLKILKKVEDVVRRNMNLSGAQEILMPMVQPASLWEESGTMIPYHVSKLVVTSSNVKNLDEVEVFSVRWHKVKMK